MIGQRGGALGATAGRLGAPLTLTAAIACALLGCDATTQRDDHAPPATAGGAAGSAASAALRSEQRPARAAATPAQLRELERRLAPQLARSEDVISIETRADGTRVLHPGDGYHHISAAIVREGGRLEVMCIDHPHIPDHAHRPAEVR